MVNSAMAKDGMRGCDITMKKDDEGFKNVDDAVWDAIGKAR